MGDGDTKSRMRILFGTGGNNDLRSGPELLVEMMVSKQGVVAWLGVGNWGAGAC